MQMHDAQYCYFKIPQDPTTRPNVPFFSPKTAQCELSCSLLLSLSVFSLFPMVTTKLRLKRKHILCNEKNLNWDSEKLWPYLLAFLPRCQWVSHSPASWRGELLLSKWEKCSLCKQHSKVQLAHKHHVAAIFLIFFRNLSWNGGIIVVCFSFFGGIGYVSSSSSRVQMTHSLKSWAPSWLSKQWKCYCSHSFYFNFISNLS